MSSFKFSPRQEYTIQKVKAQISSGQKLKFSPSKNIQLQLTKNQRLMSQQYQKKMTGHLVQLDRSSRTYQKIQKQPFRSSQSPLQEQESIMKQPCSNTKPQLSMKSPTQTSAFSPSKSSKKKLYKHLYQQIVDTESAEVISNLQDQIDAISTLLKQGVDNSHLIVQIESIVRQNSQERQRMLSEQEVQEIKNENEQLREEIWNINEKLKKQTKYERKNLDFSEINENRQNIEFSPFDYFERQYKMLDWRRSAYTKRK